LFGARVKTEASLCREGLVALGAVAEVEFFLLCLLRTDSFAQNNNSGYFHVPTSIERTYRRTTGQAQTRKQMAEILPEVSGS
jgi:hypothetical protein